MRTETERKMDCPSLKAETNGKRELREECQRLRPEQVTGACTQFTCAEIKIIKRTDHALAFKHLS